MALWGRRSGAKPKDGESTADGDGMRSALDEDGDARSALDDGSVRSPVGEDGEVPRPVATGLQPEQRPLTDRPVIRTGIYAWAVLGILLLTIPIGIAVASVSLVIIPLIVALFPAAVLMPVAEWLKRRGLPRAPAATVALVGFIAALIGVGAILVPRVAAEWDGIVESARQGAIALENFLAGPPFNLGPGAFDRLIDQAQELVAESEQVRAGLLTAVTGIVGVIVGLAFVLVALFFYLKDGDRIAAWVCSLFPDRVQADVGALGALSWQTIGSYMRGQLVVALVDAVFIGIGIAIVGVPLALPLAVLVFFGGLFPIVGAFLTGALAVLVALAHGGLPTALIVLAIVVAVQQLESNLLAPLVLGRATALHPLAVLVALSTGGLLLGVLGAFIAVPIAASGVRAIGYLRQRTPG